MSRRANSEGSVYQRASDGKWVSAVALPDGRRRIRYSETQKQALANLKALHQMVADGLALLPGREMTVAAYLQHWTTETLPARVKAGRLAPSTLSSYRDQVRLHIAPDLGLLRLRELSAPQVRAWLNEKQTRTGHRGRVLSSRSVAYAHAVLRAALADAVRDDLIHRNVCLLVTPPRSGRPSASTLSPEDVAKILIKSEGRALRALWVLLIAVGLRKGEALALHWEDLDLAAGTIRVHRTLQRLRDAEADPVSGRRHGRLVESPTTKTGVDAILPLPSFVVKELEEHRLRQLKVRLAAPVWVEPDRVFTTRVGTPLEPRNVARAWADLCEAAAVAPVRIHDLRHTAATLLLGEGVPLKVVQQMLRHSRLATTADVYAHVTRKMERAAADSMDSVFQRLPTQSPG